MEKCIIISQSEAKFLLLLLNKSIDQLYSRTVFRSADIGSLEILRSNYQSVVNKLEESFNG